MSAVDVPDVSEDYSVNSGDEISRNQSSISYAKATTPAPFLRGIGNDASAPILGDPESGFDYSAMTDSEVTVRGGRAGSKQGPLLDSGAWRPGDGMVDGGTDRKADELLAGGSGGSDEGIEIVDMHKPVEANNTLPGAIANLTNVIIGSGIIGLPNAVEQCGFVFGTFLLIFVGFITDYSLREVVAAGRRAGVLDYEELARHCFGQRGYKATLVVIFLLDFGTMVSYVVITGDTMTPVMNQYIHNDSILTKRRFIVFIMCMILMLPVCCLRHMKELGFVSILSVSSIFLIITAVGVQGFHHYDEYDHKITIFNSDVFSAFGTMAFAYVCHDVSFQVYQSLKVRNEKRWAWTSHGAVGIALVTSLVISVLGYLCFDNKVNSNILKNFPQDDTFVNIARITLSIAIFLTFPINLFMCRHVIARATGRRSALAFTLPQHLGVTFLLFSAALGLGLVIRDLGAVQSFVGGLTAVLLAFILPALFSMRVYQLKDGRKYLSWANWKLLCLFVFGLVVMICSVVQSCIIYF